MDFYVGRLEEYGMIYPNQHARFISPGYVVPKVPNPTNLETDYRFTIDCREPNKRSIEFQWPMPVMEQVQEYLAGSKFFMSLDMKDGYWQCPLYKDSQEFFSFATHRGVWTPNRVIQGATGAVFYFQGTIQNTFAEILYRNLIVWIDDLLLYAESIEELFKAFKKVLGICRKIGFKLSVKKCVIFARHIKWCDE
jgi:hypothetical protein